MGVHPKYGYSCILPKASSVVVPEPATKTSSSTNPSSFPIKKRLSKARDSPTKIKLIRFATIEEEEGYYYQKIQGVYKKKLKLFVGEDGPLDTKKGSKKRTCTSTDREDKKKKMKIPKKLEVVKNEVTMELERFITGDEMNGLDAKVVIQKMLYRSDLKKDQNRLNMPIKQLLTHDFLTAEEKKYLEDEKNINVRLVGPTLKMYEKPMVLRAWNMERTKNYVLKTNWNSFVKDNRKYLKEGSMIQVWSFRKDQELCFALVVVDRPDVVNEVA